MLSERIMTDLKKNFTINFLNNDKMKSSSENTGYNDYNGSSNNSSSNSNCMKAISNGDLTVNNNNNIKSERLSPINNDVQSTASRSRSITPSSFSGTPPQTMHSHDLLAASTPSSILPPMPNPTRPEFQARNYSDFMRSLAAKYNNGNNNDPPPTKNSFLEPRSNYSSPKTTKDNLLNTLEQKKSSPLLPQVPNQNLISSLFSGLPFPTGVFPPLIDMSSTQALVSLAKAAKEAELQSLLKGTPNKKLNTSSVNFPTQFPASALPAFPATYSSTSTASHSPFSMAGFQTSSTPSASKSATKHPARTDTGHPLDLSSAPLPKKIKLSSQHGDDSLSRAPTTSPPVGSATSTSSNQSCSSQTTNYHQQQQQQQQQQQHHVVQRKCQAQSEEINSWNVDQVCEFIGSIDICVEYVQNFREQSIDGTGLPQLTEEHLTNSLGLKLGPALKLKSVLAKKLGGPCPCVSCSAALKFEAVASTTPAPSTTNTSNNLSRPTSNDSAG